MPIRRVISTLKRSVLTKKKVTGRPSDKDVCPAEDLDFLPIWNLCRPYTMTSFSRGLALFRAVRYLVQNRVPGDIIECGVWRGGSTMIAMATARAYGDMSRNFVLMDTFQGMTEPGEADIDLNGVSFESQLSGEPGEHDPLLCFASIAEVKRNIALTGYPSSRVEYLVGDIRATAPTLPRRTLSLLRLDTDFYDSTKVELDVFYPWLSEKGVLIIDDYGHWQGARRAVDEYWDTLRSAGHHAPMISIIDYTGRQIIK